MKKFISFSGGVESSAMAVLYGKGSTLLWTDTGGEHRELYERIDQMEEFLNKFHKGECTLIRLKGSYKSGGVIYDSLSEAIVGTKFFPSISRRYCTGNFKIKPIDEFLRNQGECELMIGFNIDEETRAGNLEKMANVKYSYPLIKDEYSRGDCEEILKFHGIHPQFPVYMARGGCKFCFFKTEKEYKAMYHLDRESFDEVLKMETELQDKRGKHYSFQSNGKPMWLIGKEASEEMDFNWEEVYKATKKVTYCGAFCHR